ncbi:hypothetical protein FB451DRAFT_1272634 [Mycena latifolia]|nr:hypothetical protein FB451DRAFT_1272634 [Mycena latifolia]
MVCVRTFSTVTSLLIAALFPDPLKFVLCHLGRVTSGLLSVALTSRRCSRNLQFHRLPLPSHPPNLPNSTWITHVSFLNEKSPSLRPWHLIGGVAGFLVFAHVGGVGRGKFTGPSTLHLNSGKLYGIVSLWLV